MQFSITDGESSIVRRNTRIQLIPVNDKPNLAGLTPVSYRRNTSNGVAFARTATVSDVDSVNFNGGELKISVTGGELAKNRIFLISSTFSIDASGNIMRAGVIFGTVSQNSGFGAQAFVVKLNSTARASHVTGLLRSLRFRTTNSTSDQVRRISISLSDGDGGVQTALASVLVSVTS